MDFGGTGADSGPEEVERGVSQRPGGVDEEGERVDALGVKGREIQAGIDEAAIWETPTGVRWRGIEHVPAQLGVPVHGGAMGVADAVEAALPGARAVLPAGLAVLGIAARVVAVGLK